MDFYRPLNPKTNNIRLLALYSGSEDQSIQCDLILHDLDNPAAVRFYALSYTWGDLPETDNIHIRGKEFPIRPNLKAALRQLRNLPRLDPDVDPDVRYVWVDALCINQKDTKERSEQVVRMRDIYEAAQTTVVWLGMGTLKSDHAMDFMNANTEQASRLDPVLLEPGYHREEFTNLAGHILMRRWWQRVWIVQEVSVSNHILVLCGTKKIRWQVLINFLVLATEYHKPAVSAASREIDDPERSIENLGLRLDHNRKAWTTTGPRPLSQLLTAFRSWRATNPVDKIYGLLGMATEAKDPALTPNYSLSPQIVFGTATKFIIEQSQRLDWLIVAKPQQLPYLPSWVPDFSLTALERTPLKGLDRLLERYLYSAAKELPREATYSNDGSILFAKGVRVDAVANLAPYWDPNLAKHEFDVQLPKTLRAWNEFLKPLVPKIKALYGALDYRTLLAKVLTADRKVDYYWNRSRFEPKESFATLPLEPPEEYRQIGTKSQQLQQWDLAKNRMIQGTLSHRRLFVTGTGYLGLAPDITQLGDIVCVLLGCDTPLVLRPQDQHYLVVGECYVFRIMDGEIINKLEEGLVQKQCFEIR